jgi:ribosomal protein S27AE
MELGRKDSRLVQCGKCGLSLDPTINQGSPDETTSEWMITRAYHRSTRQNISVQCTRCGHYTIFIPRRR